ncbi:MAG: arginase family protein [Candidatus Nitrosopumilus limneticus]|nr:Arginase [Candidatus Nitrosopumilus limneticus]MDC4212761.1 arginase family protein [Candidatus Nitrosopumilus limneticus]MDC4213319.1 arginase family protein [Candidatus Nitrosopumilus limneticus]MDC4215588.1 arginase family protein [Candidatus Nitrosopumilus limneticus]MDC4216815.1 arginase family protein [Candidatus Nitrosopumilus limneticus]
MESICWSNCKSYGEAEYVILGLNDESQSHSLRKGTSSAPDRIRKISNERDVYIEKNIKSIAYPYSGKPESKIFDLGNVPRENISFVYERMFNEKKIPITMGGDHSLTFEIIKELGKKFGPVSLVYFDAHPDFISSTKNFYGSVIHDCLPYIDPKSSVMIGIRSPELEEIENIKKYGITVITPEDVQINGYKQILETILAKIGKNIYISFDMDALDPSFAPGVSVPVPMGLNPVTSSILIKNIARKGILGMDIMEVCPAFDVQDNTSHLASRMIGEFLSSVSHK